MPAEEGLKKLSELRWRVAVLPRRALQTVCATVFLLLLGYLFYYGLRAPFDSHDGYAFLLQARRFTDNRFSMIGPDFTRPKCLIVVLALFDYGFHFITGALPSVIHYHLLSAAVALACVLVWWRVATRLFGRMTGYWTALILMIHPLFVNYASPILADVLGALWMGCFFLCAQSCLKKLTWQRCFLLGVFGGLLGTSKYQYYFFVPCFIALTFLGTDLFRTKWKISNGLGSVFLGFILTVELIYRSIASPDEGFFGTLKMYLLYGKAYMTPGAVYVEPWDLYLKSLLSSYGVLLFSIGAMGCFYALRFVWQHREKVRASLEEPKALLAALLIVQTLAFLALNQVIRHREPRYLLTLLPATTLLGVVCVRSALLRMPRPRRRVWQALILVGLLSPLATVVRDLRARESTMSGSAYVSGLQQLISFLAEERDQGRCTTITAHREGSQHVLPMLRFSLPGVNFTRTDLSQTRKGDFEEIERELGEQPFTPRDQLCHLFFRSQPNETSTQQRYMLYRPIAEAVIAQDRDVADLRCEFKSGSERVCYIKKEFVVEIPRGYSG